MIKKHDVYIRKYLGEVEDEHGNPYKKYGDIITIESSLNTTSSSYDAMVYGERAKRIVQAFIDYDMYIGMFNEGDLVYLYGATYENESYTGANANYQIESVQPQNVKIKIVMEKLP